MPLYAPTKHRPPDFFSKWRHLGNGTVYTVLDPNVAGKPDANAPWRHGVIFGMRDEKTGLGAVPSYWRSLEAFYDELVPV